MSAIKQRLCGSTAIGSVLAGVLQVVATQAQAQQALPTRGTVASGAVTITRPSSNSLAITQSSTRAVINWNSFSIGRPNSVTFIQPSSSSATLNCVTGSTTSSIAGRLSANGQVYLVNPNGIAITSSGAINVGGGFVASTLGISDRDFNSGNMTFRGNGASKAVTNDGRITTGEGGFVGLFGGSVSNSGTISVPLGKVGIGSGERVSLDLNGDGFMQVALPTGAVPGNGKALVEAGGKISAKGGQIEIKAATVRQAMRDAVNVSGMVSARTASGRNGSIVLGGGAGGKVAVSGRLSASGKASAGKIKASGRVVSVERSGVLRAASNSGTGGAVSVEAPVAYNGGTIDASGASGGKVHFSGISVANYGVIDLRGLTAEGGVYTVNASTSYVETIAGSVQASGLSRGGSIDIFARSLFSSGTQSVSSADGTGGSLTLTGNRINLVAASLDASGATGGGTVLIGGGFQGKGPLPHADTVGISPTTTIKADATRTGDGGTVVVWSDKATNFYGSISARGGAISGGGGLAEISSKRDLVMAGTVDLAAAYGKAGRLLLDPGNLVVDDTTGIFAQYPLINPIGGSVDEFGAIVVVLPNGNTVVTAPGTNIGGNINAGAVYFYKTKTGALISQLTGSATEDLVGSDVQAMGNNHFAIFSPDWSSRRGAFTVGHGLTGISGVVSAANSLIGVDPDDLVGGDNMIALGNGKFLVTSNEFASDAGAVTWIDPAAPVTGQVSASNSLVGSNTNDNVGQDVAVLSNGNYIVLSPDWNNQTGAATWGSGASGVRGVVSAARSLVGSTPGDRVGDQDNFVELGNGNAVIGAPEWTNASMAAASAGAATWMNGSNGQLANGTFSGPVSQFNSLVGTLANDSVGQRVTALPVNNNYVVKSPAWNDRRGAVTWGNGTAGTVGVVSAANSLVGTTAQDDVGINDIMTLTNGNFVALSGSWRNVATAATSAGAATWFDGSNGRMADGTSGGPITSANSLIGTSAFDQVGLNGNALTNGNYVVLSNAWNNAAGAVTWGNGSTGTVGVVSAANSLVGTSVNDRVGVGGINAFQNGNYVVISPNWSGDQGAATFVNGANGQLVTGVVGQAVSAANSLVGSSAGDRVGLDVVELNNGNYVVRSSDWNNLTGAVTWGSGTTGIAGVVSGLNSLIGAAAGDQAGSHSIQALNNGNYVVSSREWNGDRGAITWVNGSNGRLVTGNVGGTISSTTSLVGSTPNDRVGSGNDEIVELPNGNFVVLSPDWNNGGGVSKAGAVTWVNGATGISGAISASTSLVGNHVDDFVGQNGIAILSNGNYVVQSIEWNGSRGAATWGNAATGVRGEVSAANSIIGSAAGEELGSSNILLTNGSFVVLSPGWNDGRGAAAWVNGSNGRFANGVLGGTLNATNSLVGSNPGDNVGSGGTGGNLGDPNSRALSDGNYIVSSSEWSNGRGAETFGNGTRGIVGVISAKNSILGSVDGANTQYSGPGDVLGTFLVNSTQDANGGAVRVGVYDLNLLTYDRAQDRTLTITSAAISDVLNTGTALTLQASNDITINSAITVTPTGAAGDLTLHAGRSVLLNANITTAGGDFTIISNDNLVNGVVDAQRAPGAAVITMAPGTSIDAGTGAVSLNIYPGTGKSNSGAGALTLRSIAAGSIFAHNAGEESGSNVVIAAGTTLTASGTGTPVVLGTAHAFINNSGANAIDAPNGRWLIYSANPGGNTFGNLDSGNTALWNRTVATPTTAPPTVPTEGAGGNRYLFAMQPTLTFTADDASKTYGDTFAPSAFSVAGFQNGIANAYLSDTAATAFGGTPSLATAGGVATADRAGAPYTIDIATGTLTSLAGYAFTFESGRLTVNRAPLTIAANDATKTYDGAAFNGGNGVTYTGFVNGENASVLDGSISFGGTSQGARNAGTHVISPIGQNSENYAISFADGALTINQRALTITAASTNKTYDGTTASNGTPTSALQAGDTFTTLIQTFNSKNAGARTLTPTAVINDGNGGNNYNITLATAPGFIGKADLTAVANNVTKTYDGATFSGGNGVTYSGFVNGEDASALGGSLSFGGTSQGARNAGSYTIEPSGQTSGNYNIAFGAGALTVNQRAVTITAASASKTYDGTTASSAAPTSDALQSGDSYTSLMQAFNSRNAGSRTLMPTATISDGNGGNNYSVTFATALGVIGKANLTAVANNVTKIYDGANFVGGNGVTYSGFVNGEDASVLGGALTLGGTSQGARNAGSYTVTPGGQTSGNYNIAFGGSTLTVNPRAVTIVAITDTKTYDGTTTSNATPIGGSLQAGDRYTSLTQMFDSKNAGVRTLTPTAVINDGNNGNNYDVTLVTAPGTITPAGVTTEAAVSSTATPSSVVNSLNAWTDNQQKIDQSIDGQQCDATVSISSRLIQSSGAMVFSGVFTKCWRM